MKQLFGKKPKPEPVPEAQSQPTTVDVNPQTFGIAPAHPATIAGLTPEAVEQMQSLAIQLTQQCSLYEHHAQATEAAIEAAQRLYGRQIQHQSKLQDLKLSRFPIDLLAAGLVMPQYQQQAQAAAEPRRSSVRAAARKILDD